ncbi:MAG: hypothetical protein ABI548_20455 [Polyangiaceae bacterium]
MKSKHLRLSLIALGFVAVVAMGYAQFAKKLPQTSPDAAAARPRGSAELGKGVCDQAADPCSCATDHGGQLLLASFPERALQVVSRAPASCVTPGFLGVRAEAMAAVDRGPEAVALASQALKAEPTNRFARRAQAIAAIQNKDFEVANAALAKLVAEDAKDVDSLFYAALYLRRAGKYNGAREGFLRVLRIDAQYIDARYNLVTLTAAAGAAQEADHDYQELLQIAPVGDPRLTAARSALNHSENPVPTELPILHRGPPSPSSGVTPTR